MAPPGMIVTLDEDALAAIGLNPAHVDVRTLAAFVEHAVSSSLRVTARPAPDGQPRGSVSVSFFVPQQQRTEAHEFSRWTRWNRGPDGVHRLAADYDNTAALCESDL